MPFHNKEIVRRLYKEVWNERKFEVAEELLSKTHALADPLLSGSSVGPNAYLGQVHKLVNAFPDLRFHIDELICEKDKVAVSWVASGTHTMRTTIGAASTTPIAAASRPLYSSHKGKNGMPNPVAMPKVA